MAYTEDTFEMRHRHRKRAAEMDFVMRNIEPFLVNRTGGLKILEFGSGDGYQMPYLRRFGRVIASDVYRSERISRIYPHADFIICDVRNIPFDSGSFDFVFSSHVLEHVKDIEKAFLELRRIGTGGCIYAFTVPTSTWLLLSVPAQYYNGLRKALNKSFRKEAPEERADTWKLGKDRHAGLFPKGHGWRRGFLECLDSFRVKNWLSLFRGNGFSILGKAPLLLYAPSEFPVIPTTRFFAEHGIYSSMLFILRKEI